ncbi:D-Ala-D-Ala carboxypeptidase family metallohydrolase [Sphingomonas ginkgonis]|nr:D-Ala-D-Ala carboxypeptidase family metallohydrolase [Sphingomonas ginkgonis]
MSAVAALLLMIQASPILPAPAAWDPAADYITPGQDANGYRSWVFADPTRMPAVTAFHNYLTSAGVAYVVPTWQLLRTATDWTKCGAQPFEVPPTGEWPNIVQTLRYVRDDVVPAVGQVEAVSAYRNATLNRCALGAKESAHLHFSAVDLVPLAAINRGAMMQRLCASHAVAGQRYGVGLGFYTKMRFHVDSTKFRTWGRNDEGTTACARSWELAHANDVAPPALAVLPGAAPLTAPVPGDPLAPLPGSGGGSPSK